MDNISTLNFILLQFNSVLICFIRVSIRILHFKRETELHNHILRSLIGNPDLLSIPKFSIDIAKGGPSHCFFSNYRPLFFHQFPNRKLVANRAAPNLNTPVLAASKFKLTEIDRKFELQDSCQNSISFFSIKQVSTFSKKITIEKLTFVKEDSREKSSILILTTEILHSKISKECFLYG